MKPNEINGRRFPTYSGPPDRPARSRCSVSSPPTPPPPSSGRELQTPPGDALFGTDTSGLLENYILYGGREVLPIGGYLGNVPAPTLATLQAGISRGYVRVFMLPVSPPGPDPRVRWIESHCARQPPPPDRRPVVRELHLRTRHRPGAVLLAGGHDQPHAVLDPALKPNGNVVLAKGLRAIPSSRPPSPGRRPSRRFSGGSHSPSR
jgi:hypothetical protein